MKRFTYALIAVTLMIVTLSITLAASAAKGKKAYGNIHYGAKYFPIVKDKAWSTITRNKDYPVSNSLYVGMWVQYRDGNQYYWLPPMEQYLQNAEKADVVKRQYNIYSIWTQFGASAAGCDRFDKDVTAEIDDDITE